MQNVAIIVPTLNEEPTIAAFCKQVVTLPNAEVIVVDGGSTDATASIVESHGIRCIQSIASRSVQQNMGANHTKAPWLLFLHADTYLPLESFNAFQRAIQNNTIRCGSFRFTVAEKGLKFRWLERYVMFRSKYLKLPFGDQALFFHRSVFEEVGGFCSEYPFMEDLDIVTKVNKRSTFQVLPYPVITSARRYMQEGFVRRGIQNLVLQFRFAHGVHPKELIRFYTK